MSFLYQELDSVEKFGAIKDEQLSIINDNLNPKLELREYQNKAFNRFYFYFNGDMKPQNNIHLAYNMATGSGKTVIMSGLILYLYNQGYRNFLFFVNRGQIVEKTKDNFINSNSNKYLFNDKIIINNKEVKIKAVDNFSYSSSDDINICFTTIQGLFSDMHNEKENSLTIEDFNDKKIALIADEAHHINASTKKKSKQLDLFDEIEESATWENTVDTICKANKDNILLEFTATLELDNKNIKAKYLDKIIYKYDLKDFVQDKYSKKIDLFKSDVSKNQRVLQALLTSVYREEIANKYGLNIKPVVLLKSSKIAESQDNQDEFNSQLEELKASDLEDIKSTTNIEILKTIFEYFNNKNISLDMICEKIRIAFSKNKILCTNNDKELELNQKLLNSLEDKNNPIRAIFTVDKLNEGWDVLNLFDIVRLYEGQSTGGANKGKVGKKTISEAQLVGRGARYCPFRLEEHQELFKRKYDDDITNELRVLEELYFHSENESRYISEIKKALIEQGLIEDEDNEPVELKLKLKDELQNVSFLKKKIFLNERKKKNYNYVKKLKDFGIAQSNFMYELRSGKGSLVDVFDKDIEDDGIDDKTKEKNLVDFIGFNIIQNAILQNDFYTFSSLKRYLPNLNSIQEFITDDNYLKQYDIDINGDEDKINNLTVKEKLEIILSFLNVLENEMKNNIVQYEGTKKFKPHRFDKIFKNKTLLIPKDKEKDILENNDKWFAFKEFYGTSEEVHLMNLIGKLIDDIKLKYKKDEIYLVRNERHFKIYSFDRGQAFEPDFVLFTQNTADDIHFQIFIEPKGSHLILKDKWKNDFLSQIKDNVKGGIIEFENEQYKILGLQFYNKDDENTFRDEFKMELGI